MVPSALAYDIGNYYQAITKQKNQKKIILCPFFTTTASQDHANFYIISRYNTSTENKTYIVTGFTVINWCIPASIHNT